MTYRFHPGARRELEEVSDRYESVSAALGRRFANEVADGINKILEFPEAWQVVEFGLRRYRLRSFPYGLVYRVQRGEVQVIAVMHLRRRAGYWKDRI